MTANTAWMVWGNINEERIRAFLVAVEKAEDAVASLKQLHPEVIVISQSELPGHLLDFLKLKQGSIIEWVPADGSSMAPPFAAAS